MFKVKQSKKSLQKILLIQKKLQQELVGKVFSTMVKRSNIEFVYEKINTLPSENSNIKRDKPKKSMQKNKKSHLFLNQASSNVLLPSFNTPRKIQHLPNIKKQKQIGNIISSFRSKSSTNPKLFLGYDYRKDQGQRYISQSKNKYSRIPRQQKMDLESRQNNQIQLCRKFESVKLIIKKSLDATRQINNCQDKCQNTPYLKCIQKQIKSKIGVKQQKQFLYPLLSKFNNK